MNETVTWSWHTFEMLSLQDLYELLALRQSVFIIEQQCIYPDIDNKDMQAMHLLGKKNNTICAYVRLFPKDFIYPDSVCFGRFVTAPSARGQGLAKEALMQVLGYLDEIKNTDPIVISAQLYLQKFYASFGFLSVGEPYEEDGILHIQMRKNNNEKNG